MEVMGYPPDGGDGVEEIRLGVWKAGVFCLAQGQAGQIRREKGHRHLCYWGWIHRCDITYPGPVVQAPHCSTFSKTRRIPHNLKSV